MLHARSTMHRLGGEGLVSVPWARHALGGAGRGKVRATRAAEPHEHGGGDRRGAPSARRGDREGQVRAAVIRPRTAHRAPRRANVILAESLDTFRFDETHLPHISLVHAYVKASEVVENGPL